MEELSKVGLFFGIITFLIGLFLLFESAIVGLIVMFIGILIICGSASGGSASGGSASGGSASGGNRSDDISPISVSVPTTLAALIITRSGNGILFSDCRRHSRENVPNLK